MPSNIVKLNEVVPGIAGTTFELDGNEYHVPGDLPTSTTFELLALFEDLITFQQGAETTIAKKPSAQGIAKVRSDLKTITDMIDERLLAIFQIKQPEMKEWPFGSKVTNYILGEIFEMVGLASKDPAGSLPAPPTPRPRARSGETRKPQSSRKK